MTHPARISFCLAAISLAALSACAKSSENAPLTFDASSPVKYDRSFTRIAASFSEAERLILTRAVSALVTYPLDGNCDINNVLAHIEQHADPAFRQKVRLRRLHGLTAEQVIDQAEEKNCNAALDAHVKSLETEAQK